MGTIFCGWADCTELGLTSPDAEGKSWCITHQDHELLMEEGKRRNARRQAVGDLAEIAKGLCT